MSLHLEIRGRSSQPGERVIRLIDTPQRLTGDASCYDTCMTFWCDRSVLPDCPRYCRRMCG